MKEPSEILREEHVVIEHLLHVLDGMAEHVDLDNPVPERDIGTALEVVENFADKCHHAKEERILFPALSRHSAHEGALLARRLHGDHEAARKLVRDLRELTPKIGAKDDRVRREFSRKVRTYTTLLREHISQETERLLPLIDEAIPAEERRELAEAFERVEQEEMGAGVHAKYERLVHQLVDRYVI
ncbi:MAG TPA: hemerythrin domain-containing protein [Thermoplasmata archaeon]|nr:hemerythrin domain-containing protein [Thermoplasmata archaeon]